MLLMKNLFSVCFLEDDVGSAGDGGDRQEDRPSPNETFRPSAQIGG